MKYCSRACEPKGSRGDAEGDYGRKRQADEEQMLADGTLRCC
jgi:hypothetical protein